MTESKWGKNIRGYSSIEFHLRFAYSASEQLAGAEWIFQTQQVQTPECSRRTYRVSTVIKSSAITSRHQPREKITPHVNWRAISYVFVVEAVRAPRRMFLLNNSQHISRIYRLPLRNFDLSDLARFRGLDFVLHLHRFDDHHALARGHFVSGVEQYADDFAGHRRRELDLPACRCGARLPAQMFFIARGDGNSFAVDDHFDGAARRFFQGAAVDAIIDDDGKHSRLRLADLRLPSRAAETQLGRALGQGEFPLDHLTVNFEFDFHLNE